VALLENARQTQLATIRLPAQMRDWPRIIVWGRRTFVKASTGNPKHEIYRERSSYWVLDRQVQRGRKFRKD
jgi:hypothetical protein